MIPGWLVEWLPVLAWTSAGLTATLLAWLLGRARRPAGAAGAGLAALASIAGLTLYWVANDYTGEGFNEAAWFHLALGWRGLTSQLLGPFVFLAGLLALALALLGWLAVRGVRRRAGEIGRHGRGWAVATAGLLMLASNPGLLQAGAMAWDGLNRAPYQADLERLSVPVAPPARPAKPRSLVLIYAESLELAFLEDPAYARFTPRLRALLREGLLIQGVGQAPLSSWTIAGQVASQCGFPALGGADTARKPSSSRPRCLTDVLAGQGYRLTYMNGASLEFGGKDLFWKSHGVERALGTGQVLRLAGKPEAPRSAWGAHDQELFLAAMAELQALGRQGDPFALILLTLDTHTPALPSPDCPPAPGDAPPGQAEALRALACADLMLSGFIRKARQVAGPDAVVALVSDHLRPRADDLGRAQPATNQAHNLVALWGPGLGPGVIARRGTTFDLFPTLLGALGFPTPAAHLGRDLRDPATPTLVEALGERGFYARVRSAYRRGEDGYWEMEAGAGRGPATAGAAATPPPDPRP